MTTNMHRLALLFGVASLITAPLHAQDSAPQLPARGDALSNWQSVEQCARLISPEDRHACIDQILREAGLLTVEREIAEQEESFGQRNAPQVAQRAEEAEVAARQATPAVTPTPEVSSVEATVAFARMVGRNRLLIVTDSGAVWRQTSSERIRRLPSEGIAFSASMAALGGFRCRIGRSTIYRCERLD